MVGADRSGNWGTWDDRKSGGSSGNWDDWYNGDKWDDWYHGDWDDWYHGDNWYHRGKWGDRAGRDSETSSDDSDDHNKETSVSKDIINRFLDPTETPLMTVPLRFSTPLQWCNVISNNILSDFYSMYKAPPAFGGLGSVSSSDPAAAGYDLVVDDAPLDGLFENLLLLSNNELRLVTAEKVLSVGCVALRLRGLRGGEGCDGKVMSHGFVGAYMHEYVATKHLGSSGLTGPMATVVDPTVNSRGDYVNNPAPRWLDAANTSQLETIESLKHALEKIQGPPGTGKSTTIVRILVTRVPSERQALVTCSQNAAVEVIAKKLAELENWPFCVFGSPGRVGATSRFHFLKKQAYRLLRPKNKRRGAELESSITPLDNERVLEAKTAVLERSKVFLCTIASTHRMLSEWCAVMRRKLEVHTVIVDECGFTAESTSALVLDLQPKNLILIGDHKQLAPCVKVPEQQLRNTNHDWSLLERCIVASGYRMHTLREQYRMHPDIGKLVSNLFYDGNLDTNGVCAATRRRACGKPLLWIDVFDREFKDRSRSCGNKKQVAVCAAECATLREKNPNASIMLMTFYKAQLELLQKALPAKLGVLVQTVDASMGSESDFVVLSTVRSNDRGKLGFVTNERRINVAISRARFQLTVVGSRRTMRNNFVWSEISDACESKAQPQPMFQPRRKPFFSVYADLLKKKKLARLEKLRPAPADQQ